MWDALLDPLQRETDLVTLSSLVFLPAVIAVLLLFVPGRFKELMRWVALFGSAATLTLGACRLVDYYFLLDERSDREVTSLYHPQSRLDSRSERQQADAAQDVPKAFNSRDLVTRRPWVARFGIEYALGVDGINLSLVLLTGLVSTLAVVASWNIEKNLKGYLVLLMLLQTGVIGAFLAIDLFLFYVFYELLLVPMYFLVGLWGGGRRKYAAFKFVIYTLLGSVGLLAAIVALYSVDVRDFVDQHHVESKLQDYKRNHPAASPEEVEAHAEFHSFDPFTLSRAGRAVMLILNGQEERLGVRETPDDYPQTGGNTVRLFAPGVDRSAAIARLKAQSVCSTRFQYVVFALLFLGFAVKIPIVPLHSWLPDAHVEAPTPVSMLLAGILLKLGGYGLLRFAFPLCPWGADQLSWTVGLIGVIGIVYGALVAMGQSDFKRLLAYSSISHMGYVVLGLATWCAADRVEHWQWGVSGAVFQMIAHGISASALFFVVGVVYDRAHHRDIDRLGGLMEPMPVYSGMSAVLFFASMGLPGLCGFVGEFQVILAAWNYSPSLAVPAILATILTAAYLLWAWQRVYLGVNPVTSSYPEISMREFAVLVPFVLLAILPGLFPSLLTLWIEPSLKGWVDSLAVLK